MPRGNRHRLFGGLGVLAVLSVLLYAPKLPSHLRGAEPSGVITGRSGGAIPNAQILGKHLTAGIVRTARADSAGFYPAPNLPPGDYELNVAAPEFKTVVSSGISLTVAPSGGSMFRCRRGG